MRTALLLLVIVAVGCTPQPPQPTVAELSARIADEIAILDRLETQLTAAMVTRGQDMEAKASEYTVPIDEIQARIEKHEAWQKQNKNPASFAAENVEKMLNEVTAKLSATTQERDEALAKIDSEYDALMTPIYGKIETQKRLIYEAETSRNVMMGK